MENNEYKKLLISHIDLDGFGCYVIYNYFKRQLDFTDIKAMDYQDYKEESKVDLSFLSLFDEVVYADFYPSKEAQGIMEENNVKVTVLDHHKGNLEDYENWKYKGFSCTFNNDLSGAEIFLKWILENYDVTSSDCLNDYIKLIGTYDLWKKHNRFWYKAKGLNYIMWKSLSYGAKGYYRFKDFAEQTAKRLRTSKDKSFRFTAYEENIIKSEIRAEDEMVKKVLKHKIFRRTDSRGRVFGIFKLNKKISAVASKILERYTGLDYLVILNTYDVKAIRLSMRKRDEDKWSLCDLQDVGGHDSAAGVNDWDQERILSFYEKGIPYCFKYKEESTEEEEVSNIIYCMIKDGKVIDRKGE